MHGSGVTGVHDSDNTNPQPSEFWLGESYPNPFNPSTHIRYALPEKAHVRIDVYNMLGEQVAVLVDGEQEGGYHEVRLSGEGWASGVYLYRLQAGSFVATKKLLKLK